MKGNMINTIPTVKKRFYNLNNQVYERRNSDSRGNDLSTNSEGEKEI